MLRRSLGVCKRKWWVHELSSASTGARQGRGGDWSNLTKLSDSHRVALKKGSWETVDPVGNNDSSGKDSGQDPSFASPSSFSVEVEMEGDPDMKYIVNDWGGDGEEQLDRVSKGNTAKDQRVKTFTDEDGKKKAIFQFKTESDRDTFLALGTVALNDTDLPTNDSLVDPKSTADDDAPAPSSLRVSTSFHQDLAAGMDADLSRDSNQDSTSDSLPRSPEELEADRQKANEQFMMDFYHHQKLLDTTPTARKDFVSAMTTSPAIFLSVNSSLPLARLMVQSQMNTKTSTFCLQEDLYHGPPTYTMLAPSDRTGQTASRGDGFHPRVLPLGPSMKRVFHSPSVHQLRWIQRAIASGSLIAGDIASCLIPRLALLIDSLLSPRTDPVPSAAPVSSSKTSRIKILDLSQGGDFSDLRKDLAQFYKSIIRDDVRQDPSTPFPALVIYSVGSPQSSGRSGNGGGDGLEIVSIEPWEGMLEGSGVGNIPQDFLDAFDVVLCCPSSTSDGRRLPAGLDNVDGDAATSGINLKVERADQDSSSVEVSQSSRHDYNIHNFASTIVDVPQYHEHQKGLLAIAWKTVKPNGGRLIYGTCSMNPIENEAVIAALVQTEAERKDDLSYKVRVVNLHSSSGGDVSQIDLLGGRLEHTDCKGVDDWSNVEHAPGRELETEDGTDGNVDGLTSGGEEEGANDSLLSVVSTEPSSSPMVLASECYWTSMDAQFTPPKLRKVVARRSLRIRPWKCTGDGPGLDGIFLSCLQKRPKKAEEETAQDWLVPLPEVVGESSSLQYGDSIPKRKLFLNSTKSPIQLSRSCGSHSIYLSTVGEWIDNTTGDSLIGISAGSLPPAEIENRSTRQEGKPLKGWGHPILVQSVKSQSILPPLASFAPAWLSNLPQQQRQSLFGTTGVSEEEIDLELVTDVVHALGFPTLECRLEDLLKIMHGDASGREALLSSLPDDNSLMSHIDGLKKRWKGLLRTVPKQVSKKWRNTAQDTNLDPISFPLLLRLKLSEDLENMLHPNVVEELQQVRVPVQTFISWSSLESTSLQAVSLSTVVEIAMPDCAQTPVLLATRDALIFMNQQLQ